MKNNLNCEIFVNTIVKKIMSKFLSTKYSKGAFNLGMLVLRVAAGLLLANHGIKNC